MQEKSGDKKGEGIEEIIVLDDEDKMSLKWNPEKLLLGSDTEMRRV